MIKKTKELRVQIDGLSQLVKGLKPMVGCGNPDCIECDISYETNKSYDSLILAKGWLGKFLAELGAENPYKSGYKTKEDIEPTADVSLPITLAKQLNTTKPIGSSVEEMNHIEKVDFLRTEIEKVIGEAKILSDGTFEFKPSRESAIARTNAYNHLCEAKMWLGFELSRIKEEQ